MTSRRILRRAAWSLPLVLAMTALPAGCETIQDVLGDASKPSARVDDVRLQGLALDAAMLEFDMEVSNPYAVDLPLVDVGYALASGGSTFLDGSAPMTGTVPARGKKVVTLPARVAFADLMAALSGVTPGAVVPYTADLNLSVDAPGVGTIGLPLRKEGELPIPAVPVVELQSVSWESLSLSEATAVLAIRVENTNSFPIDLTTLDYGLALGGNRVVSAEVDGDTSLAAGGESVLKLPISIRPIDIGLGAIEMFGGSGSGYELGGTMQVGTPFGPLDLPFETAGQTVFKR